MNTEQLAQRIMECRLLDARQTNDIFSALGSRGVEVEQFRKYLLSHEYLTNWQLKRVEEGHKTGFFYNNWKVLYLVGAGTFARVYRSVHIKTGEVKAVKVLRNRYTDDPITRERFLREAQTVMKLRHPNIVPIYEVENHRGRIYMVMDFIEGQNLREFVHAHGKIRLITALEITRDLLAGLEYAAQRGISHRDVKLSNVLLSSAGRACIVDFGLAAADDHDDKRSGFFNPRSVDYAGLEKLTNAPRNDKRSDIFFTGCNLYHMLTGQPPLFETRERMKRMGVDRYREIKPIAALAPELPHRVVVLVNRMMALSLDDRFQTAKEALEECKAVIDAVKSGKIDRYDPAMAQKDADDYEKRKSRINEGQGKIIMVIESNIGVQDSLRSRLKEIGYRPLILGDAGRALIRFRDLDPAEPRPADLVVFGCADLGAGGVEAFKLFNQLPVSAELPSILLIRDEHVGDYLRNVELDPARHKVLGLPVRFPLIRRAIRALLDLEAAATPGPRAESPEESDTE
jgi:eukaryotic-like serine/threonine-protein kinase